MVANVTYHNPIHQEENTPLVTILDVRVDTKQATAIDSRKSPYNIDLTKASFGATYYPLTGTQWYLKKISGVWALMARAPQQNPQLDPALTPTPGDTYIGTEGTTNVVGDLHVAGGLVVDGPDPEIGTIKIHPSNTPPSGWLICDGSAISRATYSLLFTVIGTVFGVGDGSTTFNIPNLKGRFPVGRDAGQTEFDVLGETGGEKAHALSTAELAAHTHTFTSGNASVTHTHGVTALTVGGSDGTHGHTIGADQQTISGVAGGFLIHNPSNVAGNAGTVGVPSTSSGHGHTITGNTDNQSATHTHSGTSDSTGSGTAHNNLPPYMALNYIIKVVGSYTPPSTAGSGTTALAFHAVGSVSSDIGYTATAQGDANNRFSIDDAGRHLWGSGNSVGDANLYRSAAGTLTTDGALVAAQGYFGGTSGPAVYVGNDGMLVDVNIADTVGIQGQQNAANGRLVFGSAVDTNLYRSAADTLKTDDSLIVGTNFTVGTVQVDPTGAATGHLLRHNGTKFVSVAEESNAQYPNVVVYSTQSVNATATSSTSYINITGSTNVSFTKNKAGTTVLLQMSGTFYVSNTTIGAQFALLVNGTDYDICRVAGNTTASSHTAFGGANTIVGLAAGTYTVQARWKSQGAANINMDVNDSLCIIVTEVK